MTEAPAGRLPPSLDGNVLRLGDREVPLVSGAMHYFRVAPERWSDCLSAIVALGLPIVESYVPWAVHEIAAGEYDFGRVDPGKDLARFLDLAEAAGLSVVLRPGPHVNAELECFGIPRRVVEDPSCQALSPRRSLVLQPFPPRMFPIPSHASHAYLTEVGLWYEAVAEVVRGRLHPKGPVVALQVDNEVGGFFRNGPFCQDYHPDAIEAYRAWLRAEHGSLSALCEAHGRDYASFGAVEPPTRFDAREPRQLPAPLAWARFQEEVASRSIARMRALLSDAGLGSVPTTHNLAMGDEALPVRLADLDEAVDLVGLDHYHGASEIDVIARRVRRARGTLGPAYAPEIGLGGPPWFRPFDFEDSLFGLMAACAYGLRGFNLYMTVARDRWYGAPIDGEGALRPEADAVRAFVHAFHELGLHQLEIPTEVALVLPAEYARLTRTTHLLGPLGPSSLEALGGASADACLADPLGFEAPIQRAHLTLVEALSTALDEAGVSHVRIDSDAAPERFLGYRLLISPCFEFADPARMTRLAEASRHGARVALGPRLPELDTTMRPAHFELPANLERIGTASADSARELVERWVAELELAPAVTVEPTPLRAIVHHRGDAPAALFVLNPDREPVEARLRVPTGWALQDALSGERYEGPSPLGVPMGGRSVRVFTVTSHAGPARRPSRRRPSARRRR